MIGYPREPLDFPPWIVRWFRSPDLYAVPIIVGFCLLLFVGEVLGWIGAWLMVSTYREPAQ